MKKKKKYLKKTWAYLKKPSTKKKIKVGLAKSKAFFKGMGDGIDDAMGIKAKEPDYTMRN
jgi:hypothetical protein